MPAPNNVDGRFAMSDAEAGERDGDDHHDGEQDAQGVGGQHEQRAPGGDRAGDETGDRPAHLPDRTRPRPLARMMKRFRTVVATVIGPGTKLVSISASSGAAMSAEPKPTPPCTHAPSAIATDAATACAGVTRT